MHIFIGNFTYVSDFMIIKDISLVIDPRVSHVVLGKPFVELSGMTYDSSLGVVRLTNRNEEIPYKIPHKIEQYDSISNDEKENMKSVYLRNDEDKKKGVEYIMSKILRFYKECLELGPEYRTNQDGSSSGTSENQDGGVTLYLIRRSLGVLRSFMRTILGWGFSQDYYFFSKFEYNQGSTSFFRPLFSSLYSFTGTL
ncbi:hypothetical protein Tco_1145924 [Tanacetum coccineum]